MNAIVKSIIPGSPASLTKITPGDSLRRINGEIINDVLDYEYYSYDNHLLLELNDPAERVKLISIKKPEGAGLGLVFDNYLMDKELHCVNNCIFCFIDQLPDGMRKSLYYKDDDIRQSFLQGNYITLTNLSRDDIQRIISLRISPINVSVHTLDPGLRLFMLGAEKKDRQARRNVNNGISAFRALARANITLNCQIVCCPGINDGWELSKTIEELISFGSCINSVSIVPVGLTRHRQGLTELQPFDKHLAVQTIRQVEHYGNKCLKQRGSRVFFCADEMYMTAEMELPPNEYYEEYPQLENGVGMMRLFITEFINALDDCEDDIRITAGEKSRVCSIATGFLAHRYLTNILDTLNEKYDTIFCGVFAVRNDFFGDSITVSGLVTGSDIIGQLSGKYLGEKLFIPRNMLRNTGSSECLPEDEVFLDDITVQEVSDKLGVPVRIVDQNGADFLQALLGD